MTKALAINIRESISELKAILKKQPDHLRDRIRMLILIKQSPEALSKNQLAEQLGVNPNSTQKWRKMYRQGGTSGILFFKRGGYKKPLITKPVEDIIKARLSDPNKAFRSYEELRQWIDDNFVPGIGYHTVNKFVKRKFKTKMKVARRSHIDKDVQAVEAFKKTSVHSARRGKK